MSKTTSAALKRDNVYDFERFYPEGMSWDTAAMLPQPLFSFLDRSAERFPDSAAIEYFGHVYSYATLADVVNRAARGLQDLGVTRGVKVGLFMPNSAYLIVMYYAVLKAGGTVVNYNPQYAERDLVNQVEDSGTDFMATLDHESVFSKVESLLGKTRLKKAVVCPMTENMVTAKASAVCVSDERHVLFCDLIANAGAPNAVAVDPHHDVAVLQYTGGTTGVPKGAMLTHANLYANAWQIGRWIHTLEDGKDSQLGILPMFHVFSMTVVMNMSMMKALKIIVMPQFDLKEALEIIDRQKPAFVAAVPTIFNAMANYSGIGNYDFSSLKFCLSGGAPLPVDVARLFEEKARVRRVAEGYGLTESSPVATVNPPTGVMKAGSIGVPMPGTVIDILSLEDGKTLLPRGQKGEVCISGPQVMKGYYNKPEETAKVLDDAGRLRTGDVGYIDEDGFVFLVDRIKDLILVRGYNVYPRHVEEAIYLHDAVQECIVAGVPDKARGEAVWAWVRPREGKTLTEGDLRAFLDDKISSIELPRKIIIREQPLPKTAVGKLSRKDLLEQEGIRK